jgi:hypothetical protein
VSGLLQRDYRERLAYQGGSPLTRTTRYRMHQTLRLMWEQSL